MGDTLQQTEFSRPLDVSEVPAKGLSGELRATPEECRALCQRFELESLQALAAEIQIVHEYDVEGQPALRLRAEIRAEVTQVCVVTLKPFQTKVEEEFNTLFQFSAEPENVVQEDNFGEDMTELLETMEIDVGELVAQYLSLALDPHPRAPGTEWQDSGDELNTTNMAPLADGPFAKLGQLKHKM